MITEQQKCDIINAVKPNELGRLLVERLPDEAQFRIFDGEDYSMAAINSEYVSVLAECLQAIVAQTVASLIDAGSERDAVMENDKLYLAIADELGEWTQDKAAT